MLRKLMPAVAGALAAAVLAACAPPADYGASGPKIVLGFSQVGAESGWRTANTVSIHDAATAARIKLRFSDASGKQANQIAALRSFIQQKVDVIAFSPVVESGWDEVLTEAHNAGIPVILTDRAIDTRNPALYTALIGSDFEKEGRLAGEWLVKQGATKGTTIHIAELQGTVGSAPAKDRAAGFRTALGSDPRFKVIASQPADFTRAKGEEVMRAMLKAHHDIDVVFAHNDDMGLGAIKAIEAAGLRPGVDIQVVTIDAVRDGMKALAAGKINYIVECSPLLGPQLMTLVKKIIDKQPVPDRIVTDETTFTQEQAIAALPDRKY
jgi:ABC-type sugar transport system substrate-binding protein